MRPDFATGARNAVRTCLGIGPSDRVAIISDRPTAEIADALQEEAVATGAEVRRWVMEAVVTRPAREFPPSLADQLIRLRPTASLFVGGGQPGELAFRQPMLRLLTDQLGCRHGHMIGIDARVMTDGMAADYEEVHRVTRRVFEAVRGASRIEVATALGTELTARFHPGRRWVPCDGRYHEPGRWGNLPEGEVFTAPWSLDGLIVGEEMGDHFADTHGLFEEPVRIRVREGRVAGVEMAGHPSLVAEIEAYFGQHPNADRAGEFAIGTNVGLSRIVGNFLQDEKFPGVHVAFGDPYGHQTGADWDAPSHVDVLASHADVWADGVRILDQGRVLV